MAKNHGNLIVIKRDGREEPFDQDKLTRVLIAAWLEGKDAKKIASAIKKELEKQNIQKISSLRIRDLVLLMLKEKHPTAYNFYRWYEKTLPSH